MLGTILKEEVAARSIHDEKKAKKKEKKARRGKKEGTYLSYIALASWACANFLYGVLDKVLQRSLVLEEYVVVHRGKASHTQAEDHGHEGNDDHL